MSTIDSVPIIKTILLNNGTYPGDPQCYEVWSYVNDWGRLTQAIFHQPSSVVSFIESPYIHNPQRLWSREIGLTPMGEIWMSLYQDIEADKAKEE